MEPLSHSNVTAIRRCSLHTRTSKTKCHSPVNVWLLNVLVNQRWADAAASHCGNKEHGHHKTRTSWIFVKIICPILSNVQTLMSTGTSLIYDGTSFLSSVLSRQCLASTFPDVPEHLSALLTFCWENFTHLFALSTSSNSTDRPTLNIQHHNRTVVRLRYLSNSRISRLMIRRFYHELQHIGLYIRIVSYRPIGLEKRKT